MYDEKFTTLELPSQVLFPSVVVCNINQIRKSLFNELGFYENETLVSNDDDYGDYDDDDDDADDDNHDNDDDSKIWDEPENLKITNKFCKNETLAVWLISWKWNRSNIIHNNCLKVRIMYEDFIKGTKDNSENSTYTGFSIHKSKNPKMKKKWVKISSWFPKFSDRDFLTGIIKSLTRPCIHLNSSKLN